MSSKAMSLKGKIKNYAKNNNIAAQVVLQNYMFECFLARLAHSSYKQKWGKAGNYTLCLNSSQLGYDRCEKIIMECGK